MKKTLSLVVCDTTQRKSVERAVKTTLDTMRKIQDIDLVCLHWLSDNQINFDIDLPVRFTKINPIKQFPQDYNWVMLRLVPHVVTEDFCLTVHWDGFAVNADAWTPDFLNYDYIGAAWAHVGNLVGNGGFSLRSRRLLDALMTLQLETNNPEDVVVCQHARHVLQTQFEIKIPDFTLADQFSIETRSQSPWLGKSFGFHGLEPGVANRYGYLEINRDNHGYQR